MAEDKNSKENMKDLLNAGLVHEAAAEWGTALEHWENCSVQCPDQIVFSLRLIGAALRIQKPEQAMSALIAARKLDVSGERSDTLDGLQTRVEKLQISLYRIRAVEAFDAGDFEYAQENFEALSIAVPDHPWAAARARVSVGLSPLFESRLSDQLPMVRDRIFLTGCGRSGTWLLTAMLHCVPGIRSVGQESPLGSFLELPDEPEIHLVKRTHDAYLHFDKVPAGIKILHVIRHPFDVLCSRHREKERYISLARLEAEHKAYFAQLEGRPETLTVKYEDLILHPEEVQAAVEKLLGVRSARPFREFYLQADLGDDVVDAMHGLRPLDSGSLHAWRKNDGDKAYLKELMAQSDGTIKKIATAFDYDLTLHA